MEEIRGHDKYLDPPDPPTHGECHRCGEIMDYGDMEEIDEEYYCAECAVNARMEDNQ